MTATATLASRTADLLRSLGAAPLEADGDGPATRSPVTGETLGHLPTTVSAADAVTAAAAAFTEWSSVPAPVRGAVVRELGELLREHKSALGELVSIEAGKIVSEGLGEVQEMIDICDFGVGLSRQLHGATIATERPGHRMMEQWHPLGVVAVITAFNFPVAVWSWNTVLALVAGDTVVWKPSEKTPVTAIAVQALADEAARRAGVDLPVTQLVLGEREAGEALVDDPRVALVSATGSTRMGREVAPRVAARFGRVLLELGGNNAAIVCPSADLDLTVRGIVFSAVGTAGQRCTSLRRAIVHESVADELVDRLAAAYATLPIGSPLDPDTLVGPLIDEDAYTAFAAALDEARADGGVVVTGGERVDGPGGSAGGVYVRPAVVRMPSQTAVMRRETFGPILYVVTYTDLGDAIAVHNDVPQGLSSSIFTTNLREAERFLSPSGSDCGIANVNIGPSGAEIGGAFGGEKETGGGRESGSDAWKAYMRRTTNTVNYSSELPLAQGVTFG
ncbi:L-piperidine-6-carboxylate dehydrogenase [Rhodococcoides corynebacterioides]|uniref:aldehyde dehydrogenase (NAD(+)) n=1 Tax=Rhodococcoides corynebacterioides TaxID=53972 RepID=A0ABS7P4S6_9NOCA|nr:aldehyde dehydrogenase family protein [Rhodococcus corynebacterioides]MBY6367016.1 aldehyde dehydrogenase family protein [Rhodococcus corynebacterioides]MBY6407277.1 aldehyde dehydrogenase family protein [Rhodococcus corynebacterioides]